MLEDLLTWRHIGFYINNEIRINRFDEKGLRISISIYRPPPDFSEKDTLRAVSFKGIVQD